MKRQQLEGLTITTMDQARAGNPIEDDRIEFKRDWPGPEKARQLAGAANRARGSHVIYIIGADEEGKIFPLSSMDAADWWAQISSKFDGVSPDLLSHFNVPIGESESVVALLFATDRAPYVVKVGSGGSPEREVPIRDGTRTRSARRDELLRMLVPGVAVPPAVVLECGATAYWYAATEKRGEVCSISGRATIFLEHTAQSGVMLPTHEMSGALEVGGRTIALAVSLVSYVDEKRTQPAFGVHARQDGVVATGPGRFRCNLYASLGAEEEDYLKGINSWNFRIQLGVTGSTRPLIVEGTLTAKRDRSPLVGTMQVELNAWELSTARASNPAE